LVDDDPQQPRAELVPGAEASDRSIRFHHALLSGVLSLGGVAQDQESGAEGGLLIAAHELLEGGGVALLRGGDEGCVFQRTPLAKSTPEG
jgi:hypothetical protein